MIKEKTDLEEDVRLLEHLEDELSTWKRDREEKLPIIKELNNEVAHLKSELSQIVVNDLLISSDFEDSNNEDYYPYQQYIYMRKYMNELTEEVLAREGDIAMLNQGIAEHENCIFAIIRDYVKDLSEGGGNKRSEEYGASLPRVWEFFATALLPECPKLLFGVDVPLTAEHSGKGDDWGVDVRVYYKKKLEAVVQVKRGKFFGKNEKGKGGGKGNNIVLCLVGSCVTFGVRTGIIFSNEPADNLTGNTRKLIKELEDTRKYTIRCMFVEEIWEIVRQLDSKHVVLERLRQMLVEKK